MKIVFILLYYLNSCTNMRLLKLLFPSFHHISFDVSQFIDDMYIFNWFWCWFCFCIWCHFTCSLWNGWIHHRELHTDRVGMFFDQWAADQYVNWLVSVSLSLITINNLNKTTTWQKTIVLNLMSECVSAQFWFSQLCILHWFFWISYIFSLWLSFSIWMLDIASLTELTQYYR